MSTKTLENTIIGGADTGTPFARARFDKQGAGHVKFWWYPEGSYNILDTDYNNYAIIYGCDNFFWGNYHIE